MGRSGDDATDRVLDGHGRSEAVIAIIAILWLVKISTVVICFSAFSRNVGTPQMPYETKRLKVYIALDEHTDLGEIRLPEGEKNNIPRKAVCRLTVLGNAREKQKTAWVEVHAADAGFEKKYKGSCKPDLPDDFQTAIFMDRDTREQLDVAAWPLAREEYRFEITPADMRGNIIYLCRWPQKYGKLAFWIGIIGLVLAVLAFFELTSKDLLNWIKAAIS